MSTLTPSRLLRAREVADILAVHPKKVWDLVASGDLPSIRLGDKGHHRFRLEDVERLIAGEKPDE